MVVKDATIWVIWIVIIKNIPIMIAKFAHLFRFRALILDICSKYDRMKAVVASPFFVNQSRVTHSKKVPLTLFEAV
jgi:hypothetical protein